MANLARMVDSMLKEYFLFRGFTTTLKAFENEVKMDKDKSFRVLVYYVQITVLQFQKSVFK